MFCGLYRILCLLTVPFHVLSYTDHVAYHSVYLKSNVPENLWVIKLVAYPYIMFLSWCCLMSLQPSLSVFFNVTVIFMNVKTNFFGLSILMAYVNCKGHSFYNVQNDTERLFHSKCLSREFDLSCVKVRLFLSILCCSNGQLPLLLFLHYRG